MSTQAVRVDVEPAIKMIGRIEDAIHGTAAKRVMRYGADQMELETQRAFATQSNPSTGKPWPARKHSYPWPMLRNTGHLMSLLSFGYGIEMTKTTNPRLFGKVKEGFALGGYSRGDGGQAMGAQKPNIVVVGAIMYGRKYGRSVARWKEVKGKMRWHGGGSQQKGRTSATGAVPARPFFGFPRNARARFKRRWEKAIHQAAEAAA